MLLRNSSKLSEICEFYFYLSLLLEGWMTLYRGIVLLRQVQFKALLYISNFVSSICSINILFVCVFCQFMFGLLNQYDNILSSVFVHLQCKSSPVIGKQIIYFLISSKTAKPVAPNVGLNISRISGILIVKSATLAYYLQRFMGEVEKEVILQVIFFVFAQVN